MKLIIKDKEPEKQEEVIEVWLEYYNYGIRVVSKKASDGYKLYEAELRSDRSIRLINGGNFNHKL